MFKPGVRYAVFSIRERRTPTGPRVIWTQAGSAWINRDGSMNIYLDVLPLDGKLHIREAKDVVKFDGKELYHDEVHSTDEAGSEEKPR